MDRVSLSRLLEQAVAIARDVAIGDTGIAAVVVALPDNSPPVPLFIQTDDHEASRSRMTQEIAAFLTSIGARRWIRITEAELRLPDLPDGSEVFACSAYDGDDYCSALLRVVRDDAGVIVGLEDLSQVMLRGLQIEDRYCN